MDFTIVRQYIGIRQKYILCRRVFCRIITSESQNNCLPLRKLLDRIDAKIQEYYDSSNSSQFTTGKKLDIFKSSVTLSKNIAYLLNLR